MYREIQKLRDGFSSAVQAESHKRLLFESRSGIENCSMSAIQVPQRKPKQ